MGWRVNENWGLMQLDPRGVLASHTPKETLKSRGRLMPTSVKEIPGVGGLVLLGHSTGRSPRYDRSSASF